MDSISFGKYQALYELNKRLGQRYVFIPNIAGIRQQLWNLFATDLSPGLILVTQYYSIEICGKDVEYEHDKLKQASWIIKNPCKLGYIKNSIKTIKKIRNCLVHHEQMTMGLLNECIIRMLVLNNVKDVIAKQLIELILDGLLVLCAYLENPTDKCLTCPLCKNVIDSPEYDLDIDKQTIPTEKFSVDEYSLKMIKNTLLKESIKGRSILIQSGKHKGEIATLKSWSGTSVNITINGVHAMIPVISMVSIPSDLIYNLIEK